METDPRLLSKPCALNAEFQDFIVRFSKISLLCRYHGKLADYTVNTEYLSLVVFFFFC